MYTYVIEFECFLAQQTKRFLTLSLSVIAESKVYNAKVTKGQ